MPYQVKTVKRVVNAGRNVVASSVPDVVVNAIAIYAMQVSM